MQTSFFKELVKIKILKTGLLHINDIDKKSTTFLKVQR